MLEQGLAVGVARLGFASLVWNLWFSHAVPDPDPGHEQGYSAVALAELKAVYRNRPRRDSSLLLGDGKAHAHNGFVVTMSSEGKRLAQWSI